MVDFYSPKKEFKQQYGAVVDNLEIEYIGEWRKGIAIGYSKDPMSYRMVPHLISKDKKILYRGYACSDYVEEIYRTSKGYYVVNEYRDFSAPGKDSDYRGPVLKCFISEDGKERIHHSEIKYGYFKNNWYDSNNKEVFTPKEMGLGIVEHENIFYNLTDFTKLFEIPKKYKIESIFEYGLCLFSVPEDNRDFIVIVKNKEVVEYVVVNDLDHLTKLIEKTNDTSLIKFCTTESNPTINILRKQQEIIDNTQKAEKSNRLRKVKFYSDYYFPRHYISEVLITEKEFENGIVLSNDELKILLGLYQTILKEGENESGKYRFHLRKASNSDEYSLECMFYKDFMLFRFGGTRDDDPHKMFRFYSLDGKCLSDKIYRSIENTEGRIIEKDNNFNDYCFYYRNCLWVNDKYDNGIIVIKDGKLIDNSFLDLMHNTSEKNCRPSLHKHFIRFKDERFDFFFNKISINYVNVEIEEVIKKYLYRMKPDFECDTSLFEYSAEEEYIDGKLSLPFPRELETIQSELYYKKCNRPNHIKEVEHIKDFIDENGEECSLYLFKCRPHGYCDAKGNVFYNFNPDKLVF